MSITTTQIQTAYPERGYQKVVTHGLQYPNCNPWVTGTAAGTIPKKPVVIEATQYDGRLVEVDEERNRNE